MDSVKFAVSVLCFKSSSALFFFVIFFNFLLVLFFLLLCVLNLCLFALLDSFLWGCFGCFGLWLVPFVSVGLRSVQRLTVWVIDGIDNSL